MSLRDKLVQIKPREKSGAIVSNRYDFQKDWVICHIIDIFHSREDFCVILEHHDDVIILDSASDPQTIEFYQIKTKEKGDWSLTSIIRTSKTQKESYLGKLIINLISFAEFTQSLNFVSNARYNLQLACGSNCAQKKNICITELDSESLKKIINALKKELGPVMISDIPKTIFFKVADLYLINHETYTKGKLDDFLEKIKPHSKRNTNSLYKTLFGEIKRITDNEFDVTAEDLFKFKSISKSDFLQYVNLALADNYYESKWQEIVSLLSKEEVSFGYIRKIKSSWLLLELERKKPNNNLVIKLSEQIMEVIEHLTDQIVSDMKLVESVDLIYQQVLKQQIDISPFDELFVKAIILEKLT